MNVRWAIRMPANRGASAVVLRLRTGVEACEVDDELWLRGSETSDELQHALRALPCTGRFGVDLHGRLTPLGARLPVGHLPECSWTPIAAWFEPVAPVAAMPGNLLSRNDGATSAVSLAFSSAPSETASSLLITNWTRWLAWSDTASRSRLSRLAFALCEDGRVIIRGTPLPPIVGQHFVETDGLALPTGLCLDPSIDPAVIRSILGINADDLVLFNASGGYDLIQQAALRPASRGATRVTEASLRGN